MRVSIADTGAGIPAEIRDRLFEPFFTTKSTHGNGLGLWVSQGIAEKHGGKIRMHTRTGEKRSGTVFSLSIPLQGKLAAPSGSPSLVSTATRQFPNNLAHETLRIAK
jgi:signal transduction histidine kinase